MEFTENNAQHIDHLWMKRALLLAKRAQSLGEVPIGAILVKDGKMVAKGYNRRESWKTPLGHAELIAIQRGSQKLEAWRLLGCTLYVTLEPCLMCAAALVQARVSRIVYGATDPKGGGTVSLYQIPTDTRLNHQIAVSGGVLEAECSALITEFFASRRKDKKKPHL
jgi:tRNA(adenine34) deaminase